MTVAHTAEGGAPEGTQHPTSTQESQGTNTNTQNQQPPTTSATATATAPSNPPIYGAAQPASMSSLPEATASVQGSDPAVDTPTETTNPTPASTSSPPPPPQPGAVPEPLPAGCLDTQGQGHSIVPLPPKVGEPIPQQQHGIAQMGGPGPVATTSTSTASATPYGYGGYGYGYGYNPNAAAPAQQQYQNQYANQIPNSTTTPFGSVYPPPQPMPSTLPMHYQTDNNRNYDRNIMADDGEEIGEKGFLDMAKEWMQTAGDKLVQVEAEVWRRINDAHDK